MSMTQEIISTNCLGRSKNCDLLLRFIKMPMSLVSLRVAAKLMTIHGCKIAFRMNSIASSTVNWTHKRNYLNSISKILRTTNNNFRIITIHALKIWKLLLRTDLTTSESRHFARNLCRAS